MQCRVIFVACAAMFFIKNTSIAQPKSAAVKFLSADSTQGAIKSSKIPSAANNSVNNNRTIIEINPELAKAAVTAPYNAIPLAGQKDYFGSMTDYVNTFCRQYFDTHNKTLAVVQNRSNDHFGVLDEVLKQHNLPKELKYLAVIESALNNKAISHAGAVGPWQMMAATARLMGLSVNRKNDDRTDWAKSTNGAAKYLSKLYEQLDDWLLVIAAYNSGPAPVLRAMQKTGSKSFWDIKQYLPKETQGHVMAFVATASIFEKLNGFIGSSIPEDFSFNAATATTTDNKILKEMAPIVVAKPKFTQEELSKMAIVRIKEVVSLDFMADELAVDRKLLKKWNDDYDQFVMSKAADKMYNLRIPKEKLDSFIEKKAYIATRSKKIIQEQGF